jgi:hypothetical protein
MSESVASLLRRVTRVTVLTPRRLSLAGLPLTGLPLTGLPLTGTIALMFGAALLSRTFSFSVAGMDWDESLYVVIAQRWLHGDLPYVAVWDQHPMGLPAIFAATTWVVGDGLLAARIAGLLAVAGTAILLTRFLGRTRNETIAGILAGLFYILYMAKPDGLAANTEVFNNLVVTAASLLLWNEMPANRKSVRAGVMFAAALLFGIGLQIKYVVFPEAALLCCTLLFFSLREGAGLGRTMRLAGVAMAGGLLPTAVATLYFWQAGALQAYIDANLRANVAYLDAPLTSTMVLSQLRFGLLPLIGLLPWPIVVVLRMRDDTLRGRFAGLALWAVIWLLATALDVVLPLKFWKHYFNALIPPLCLFAGLFTLLVIERGHRAWGWRPGIVAGVILVPICLLMIKHASDSRSINRVNVPLAIAEQIRREGSNGHDVYVFNYDPLVYAYANVVPPTRFVLSIELSEFDGSSGARSAGEITRILAASPRWIVVADPSPYAFTPRIWQDLDAALKGYQQVEGYEEEDYIQPPISVRLYRALDRGPAQTDAKIVDAGDKSRPSTDGDALDDAMLVGPRRGAVQQ